MSTQVSWAAQVAMERREIKNAKCPGDPSLQGVSKYENAFDDELFGEMWYVVSNKFLSSFNKAFEIESELNRPKIILNAVEFNSRSL